MKKFIGMFMVTIMVMLMSTGCNTFLGDRSAKDHLSGEVPKIGSKIFVYRMIGSRSSLETMVVWDLNVGDDISEANNIKTFIARGFYFPSLQNNTGGYYIVGEDCETGITFYPVK